MLRGRNRAESTSPFYATVSDTSSRDASSDASGPLLRRILESHPSDAYRVGCAAIVPDEPKAISTTVTQWIDELGIKLVITTGGTGLGVRDVTPEVSAAGTVIQSIAALTLPLDRLPLSCSYPCRHLRL